MITTTTQSPISPACPKDEHVRATTPLLVATTGAEATAVITAARLVADRLGAAPQVVAVCEPTPSYLPGMGLEPLPPELDDSPQHRLRADVERALRTSYDGDLSWPVAVVNGSRARTLARLAHDRGARLIVMGIGRHAPVDRLFGGETALQTIRVADRPVLAVSPTFAALPRHAVVAVDFSPPSVRAAAEALALLADGGTLSLVYVRPRGGELLWLGDGAMSWLQGHRVSEVFERLVEALEAPASISVTTAVLDGDPATQLLGYADEVGADLIATGSSGLGFLDRLIVGSVATRLLRRSPVSVLVVPRPAEAEGERIERMLTGTTTTAQDARWPSILASFTARNAGRPTQLEVDDPAIGAQRQERGYTLRGAVYDRHDERLELMLEAPEAGGTHLTHTIGHVTSVAVLADPHRRDLALQARHGRGQTILTFLD